jgi:hypothetical protein
MNRLQNLPRSNSFRPVSGCFDLFRPKKEKSHPTKDHFVLAHAGQLRADSAVVFGTENEVVF